MSETVSRFTRLSGWFLACMWLGLPGTPSDLLAQTGPDRNGEKAAQQAYEGLAIGYREFAALRLLHALEQTNDSHKKRQYALDLGYLYNALGIPKKALEMFRIANARHPDTDSLKAEGYTALAIDDLETAIAAFRHAIALDPGDALVHRQLGYLYRTQEKRELAVAHFQHAIDRSADHQKQAHLRREVRALQRNIWGGLSLLWRTDENIPLETLRFGDRVLSQSQGIWEGNIRLPLSLGSPDRWLAGFTRLLWSIDGLNPLPQSHSLQGGVGLKVKPFASQTLVLGVERLVAIGEFSRNDWLGRASISFGGGFEQPADQSGFWPFWSVYGDMAAIGLGHTDLQASGEARLGAGMKLGPLVVTPHALVSGLWQDDQIGRLSLIEGGPALSLALPFGKGTHVASRYTLDVTVTYRTKIAGTSRNKGGLGLQLSVRY